MVDRFTVPAGLDGLNHADQDKGCAETQFCSIRRDGSGNTFSDTITASTGAVTDRSAATGSDFKSLVFAAPDRGSGSVTFYYFCYDGPGAPPFGSISPGGEVGVVADNFVVGQRFDPLTFTSTDVGYGAKRLNYLRQDASGASTFGTILVNGGTTGVATDRFIAGSAVNEMILTATDAGFGPNLFYALRGGTTRSTHSFTSFVTNKVDVLLATNLLVVRVTNDVPAFTRTILTIRATNVVENHATNILTIRATNEVPLSVMNRVPLRVTNDVSTVSTNRGSVRSTNEALASVVGILSGVNEMTAGITAATAR